MPRPYVLMKTATSLDGCIDDRSPTRLILSSSEDKAAVDELRGSFDAILVGAETLRRDNPSLLLRDARLQEARRAKGLTPNPKKVVVTLSGNLNRDSRFFSEGEAEKIVYCPTAVAAELRSVLGSMATVVGMQDPMPDNVVRDLHARGVARLMVEGGGKINSAFLLANIVDELRVAVGPFFVGDRQAPHIVASEVPQGYASRMKLVGMQQLGDMAVLRYVPRGSCSM